MQPDSPGAKQAHLGRWWLVPAGVLALGLVALAALAGGAVGSTVTYLALQRAPAATPRAAVVIPRASPATPVPAPPGSINGDPRLSTVELVRKLQPTVVTVLTERGETTAGRPIRGAGSGVIITPSGLVATNQHVVGDETNVLIILYDERRTTGKVLARDPDQDLAFVQMEGEPPAFAELGDSDKVALGEPVLAIGSALGEYRGTVTFGIISGLNRRLPSGSSISGLIQTDAALNHGNSGGPLFNFAGQVIGINTAVVRTSGNPGEVAEGLGFAIPSNRVRRAVATLLNGGVSIRPDLGISYLLITASLPPSETGGEREGALVKEVIAGSAGARAGLRVGDVITAVNADRVTERTDLKDLLNKYNPGDSIEITYRRAGKDTTVKVTLGAR